MRKSPETSLTLTNPLGFLGAACVMFGAWMCVPAALDLKDYLFPDRPAVYGGTTSFERSYEANQFVILNTPPGRGALHPSLWALAVLGAGLVVAGVVLSVRPQRQGARAQTRRATPAGLSGLVGPE